MAEKTNKTETTPPPNTTPAAAKVKTVRVTSTRNVLIHHKHGEPIYVQAGKPPVAVPESEVARHGDLLTVVE